MSAIDFSMQASLRENEDKVLGALELVDAPAEAQYDRMTAAACARLAAPMALLSIVQPGRGRLFFKSLAGQIEKVPVDRQMPLSHSLCRFVRQSGTPFVIPDALIDPRVASFPVVAELGIRAYLGCPVHLPDGTPIGALCVVDWVERYWSEEDIAELTSLARQVSDAIAHTAAQKVFLNGARATSGAGHGDGSTTVTPVLSSQLWQGIERGEFCPFYQPQYDAQSGDIVGAEVLMRWRSPDRGLLTPAAFLPQAQLLGLSQRIDVGIMEQALRDVVYLSERGLTLNKLSLNVTAANLLTGNVSDVLNAIKPDRTTVSLEILESVIVEHQDSAFDFHIDALRECGVRIEIDDFGSGHASILGMLRLQPDAVKIDRRLVKPLSWSSTHRCIVRGIISIARDLGVETIAEGVETKTQATCLREAGCHTLQGHYFARPVETRQLAAMLPSANNH